MEMTGEYRIPAPREEVWAALNDPDMLRQAIPGCETIEKVSDTEMHATVTAKVGPVKARFKGAVTLEDLDPPQSYTIKGEGKGGAAGFAKGGAQVFLREDGDATVLTYAATADVGGKLAQLGSRLIQGTARKLADEFFGNFSRLLGGEVPEVAPVAEGPPAAEPVAAPEPAAAGPGAPPRRPLPPEEPGLLSKPWVWLVGVLIFILLLFLIFR